MKTDTDIPTADIPTAVFVVACMAAAGVFGYYAGKHQVIVQPAYVGRFKMSPDTNGTYRLGMFEPETAIVTTNEPPYISDTHIDHTAPRVR